MGFLKKPSDKLWQSKPGSSLLVLGNKTPRGFKIFRGILYLSLLTLTIYAVYVSFIKTPSSRVKSKVNALDIQTILREHPVDPAHLQFQQVPVFKLTKAQQAILRATQAMVEKKIEHLANTYYQIAYPGGDIPANIGVSTDVLVRALRAAGYDLQSLLYEDKILTPAHYPVSRWKHKRADKNIDHRRVANQYAFFEVYADSLPTKTDVENLKNWKPGDVVIFGEKSQEFPWHIAIVANKRDKYGIPYIIDSHVHPGFVSEVHKLTDWTIRGHFRFPPESKEKKQLLNEHIQYTKERLKMFDKPKKK